MDKVLGLVGLDLDLSGLNGVATTNPTFNGTGVISGSGFASAMVIGRGAANSSTSTPLSGALSIGFSAPAVADASPLGIAIAQALNGGAADATALPLGIAIASNFGTDIVSATALGGVASATNARPFTNNPKAICTALYGSASVTSNTGANLDSCTSILFIFQKSEGADGTVAYAIKNPLDIGLHAMLPETARTFFQAVAGNALGLPDDVVELLFTSIIPEFRSDIVRIAVTESGDVSLETDVVDWIGGLFGSGSPAAAASATQLTSFAATSDTATSENSIEPAQDEEITVDTESEVTGTETETEPEIEVTETGVTDTGAETEITDTEVTDTGTETEVTATASSDLGADTVSAAAGSDTDFGLE